LPKGAFLEKINQFYSIIKSDNELIIQRDETKESKTFKISIIIFMILNILLIVVDFFLAFIIFIIWFGPLFFFFHYFNSHKFAFKMDKISGKGLYQKISPKAKSIYEFNLDQVNYMIYTPQKFQSDRGIRRIYNVFIILINNTKVKIFQGDRYECEKLGGIVSDFLKIALELKIKRMSSQDQKIEKKMLGINVILMLIFFLLFVLTIRKIINSQESNQIFTDQFYFIIILILVPVYCSGLIVNFILVLKFKDKEMKKNGFGIITATLSLLIIILLMFTIERIMESTFNIFFIIMIIMYVFLIIYGYITARKYYFKIIELN